MCTMRRNSAISRPVSVASSLDLGADFLADVFSFGDEILPALGRQIGDDFASSSGQARRRGFQEVSRGRHRSFRPGAAAAFQPTRRLLMS
jgi:hypothetical protein